MDFKYSEPLRPDCKLSDFLGMVVSIKAVGREFKTTVPATANRPGFVSDAVLAMIVGFNPTNGQVKVGHTNLFPPGLRQEALRVQPTFTKPGLLAKIPVTDPDKAAAGYTTWTTQPVTDAILAAANAAFLAY